MSGMVDLLTHRSPRPVTIVVMDGVGCREDALGNAVAEAFTPNLDWLLANCPFRLLCAHGTAVGLPSDDDMGNSEVGHNAFGAGRLYPQGARLVNEAVKTGAIFEGAAWPRLVKNCFQQGGALHFIGLLSDGAVHSHIAHLEAMLERLAFTDKLQRARVHILLDGRDVGATSALEYVERLEKLLQSLREQAGVDYRIACGGGRMKITMDRYEANWAMVELGWKTHVAAQGRRFASAKEAIETLRREEPGLMDQDLPPFVIVDEAGSALGPVRDGDSVVFFNFRGDRAIEISRAFEEEKFAPFPRSPYPKALYAGMMEYDTELHIPGLFLVEPPHIEHTVGEYLCAHNLRQMAISETQKFGHVTYFWNGNRSGKIDERLEDYIEIPSDITPFELRPWMKAAQITDKTVEAILSKRYDLIRLNYPNGDMVGHTGVYPAARIAVETVDLCLGRLMEATRKAGAILIVTADHGNAEEMFEIDSKTKKPKLYPDGRIRMKTAHTLNPVWFIVYDPTGEDCIEFNPEIKAPSLTNVASTLLQLLGIKPPEIYDPPLLLFKERC
ncbi:MAG: 2,3-bisphosphoglycerate-independent phosphoglycerate mutase [Syntrophobacteraceae bacterium]|nr:2,3-bisphosphoglycerate-independent phosphoglycerate mutase [Syntrophobacteraceae bacterium]